MKYLLRPTLFSIIIFALASLVNAANIRLVTISRDLSLQGEHAIPVAKSMTRESRADMEAIKRSAYQGSLDMDGFEVRLDADAGIQVMQSLYPSSAAGSKGDEGWSALGSGMNNCAYALAIYDNKLIAGGLFTMAGGASANFIASWNGSSWSTLGSGMDHYVFALTVYDGKLVAGGWFSTAGGVSANRIAAWDGSSWSALGSGMDGSTIYNLAVYDNKLIAAGNFSTAGGVSANRIAAWDGSTWSPLGSGMNGSIIYALTVYDSKLIAGGDFTTAGGVSANYIASWDGSSWSPLGSGMGGAFPYVFSLFVYDNKLIAGGNFVTAGGATANRIASWDGVSWSALGLGMDDRIQALTSFNGNLIAGGQFYSAGGLSANYIASWDGVAWSALGSGPGGNVNSLISYNDQLIVGGFFGSPGGAGANYIAAWSLQTEVTNSNDAGDGSLRAAILNANAHLGPDTVSFAISGIITLASPLPASIDDSTVILGSTAPGGAHSVIIDGAGLTTCNGLVVQSCNNKIEGLTIRNFPGSGIEISGALSVNNMLTDNLIYNNAGLAIDLNNDGMTPNDPGDLDTGPNSLLNYPEIDSVFMNPDSSFTVFGKSPSAKYLEFYMAHPAGQPSKPEDPSGHGEAYSLIGFDTASGIGAFDFIVPKSVGRFSKVSAIAIDDSGNTSEFSENFTLAPSPLIIVAYSPVNLWVTDPDGFYIGKDALGNLSQTLFPATYTEILNDSVNIAHPKAGEYEIVVIPEEDAPVGAKYSIGIRIDGSDQAIMIMNATVPPSGTTDTVAYTVQEGWHFINGDANRNGVINALDVTYLINYLYKHGPAPDPLVAGDANCNGLINALDVTRLINFLYKHGLAPCQIQ